MERLRLEARVRMDRGKNASHRLRREGWIPGVLYGHGEETVTIQVKEKDFQEVMRTAGENAVIDLKVTGDDGEDVLTPGLVREKQLDPVWNRLLHIDFIRVSLTEKITAEVPVVTLGESAGQKQGGILDHVLRHVTVECLPDKIPEKIEVDVTGLEIGHSLHVRDLKTPEEVIITTEGGRVIVSIVAPRIVEEEIEKKEVEEPELVEKGKEEKVEGEVEEEKKEESKEGKKKREE